MCVNLHSKRHKVFQTIYGKIYSSESLFSPDFSIKYIDENRNLDICVADHTADPVAVKYSCLSSTSDASFQPFGITTDNQSRILTVGINNNRIHIIDHNGECLRYIDNCDLHFPWALCLDTV